MLVKTTRIALLKGVIDKRINICQPSRAPKGSFWRKAVAGREPQRREPTLQAIGAGHIDSLGWRIQARTRALMVLNDSNAIARPHKGLVVITLMLDETDAIRSSMQRVALLVRS